MTMLFGRGRRVFGAVLLFGFVVLAGPLCAQQSDQQPVSVNPTASSVTEDQLLREFDKVQGRGTIPDVRSYTVEQPAGRDWRHFHEVTLHLIGSVAVLGMLALLALFLLVRGRIRMDVGRSGRLIQRFNGFERFVHWLTASCFVILALSGLNITFGKRLLLPVIGPEPFAEFSQWAKYAHNYLSFPFTIGVVLIFLMWIGGNLPDRTDIEWIRRGGGLIGHDNPPAYRFNTGQKMVYWIVVLGGAAMAVTGYLLMFPFYTTNVTGMQEIQMIHGVVAMLYVAALLAHIYIGSIGMEGAFEAMGTGEVDLNWAKEHHSLWVEEELGRAATPTTLPPAPSATPAE